MATSVLIPSASGTVSAPPRRIGRGASTHFDLSSFVLPAAPQPAAMIHIAGEPFLVEQEDGLTYLTHARWSLLGAGHSVSEARDDLLTEARQLALLMKGDDVSALSGDAARLREFVLGLQ